ncbi:MAG: TIGR04086 family membrane protein [Candidatus Scatomorpha sp.]
MFGPALGAVAAAALLYLTAVLLERQILPYSLSGDFVIACLFLGSTAGGAAAAKRRGSAPLPSGLIAGAAIAAAVVIVSLMAQGEGAVSADCLRHVIASVAGGAFGGALCLNRGGGKRKKRSRKR